MRVAEAVAGRGRRGHHDTSLAARAGSPQIREVPARGADVPMDLVVTESRAVVCSAGRL
jgi:hypothetical protein